MSNDIRVAFKADTSNFHKGIEKVSGAIKSLGLTIGAVMAPLAALAGAVSFGAGIKDVLEFGDGINDMANKAGVAASEITVLQEALRQAGIEGVDVATILQKLSKNIFNGMADEGSKVAQWMNRFGLSMKDIDGKSMVQKFELISSRIGGLGDDTLKAAAASDLFGAKQGLLLVNLFKTENAMADAKQTVGGLASSMDKWASGFGYINDMLGAIPIKAKQFFAAFVGNNIEDLTALADAIKKLDLTKVGAGAGQFIQDISNGIKNGNAGTVLWDSLKFPVQKLGEELMSLFVLLGQTLSKAIEDSLKGTKIGDYLGIGKDKRIYTRTNGSIDPMHGFQVGSKYQTIPYQGIKVESYDTIRSRYKNFFGSVNTEAEWNKATAPNLMKKFEAPNYRSNFLKEFSDEWKKTIPISLPANFKDIYAPKATSAKLQKIEQAGIVSAMEPFKPVLSSLARIGGSAAALTKDPLVVLQQTANQHLKTIADNTGRNQFAAFG